MVTEAGFCTCISWGFASRGSMLHAGWVNRTLDSVLLWEENDNDPGICTCQLQAIILIIC